MLFHQCLPQVAGLTFAWPIFCCVSITWQFRRHRPVWKIAQNGCRWVSFYSGVLEKLGYKAYPDSSGDLQSLEVYPYASYAALLDVLPFQKYSIEGRLQRQLALYERKVKLPDPMLVFEEITRYKLLRGILPLDQLYQSSELDALVAAYTAWLAANHPEQVSSVGDIQEGQIVLPVATLKPRYTL